MTGGPRGRRTSTVSLRGVAWSAWGAGWQRFRRSTAAKLGAAATVLVVLAALLAPLLAPHDRLGTDAYSRDVLSRLLYGARVSLAVGLASATLAVLIGGLVGLAAGLGGPTLDALLMRGVDVLMALPRFFLLLAALALWRGAPLGTLVLLIALTGWFQTSRLVRAHTRILLGSEWPRATIALGGGRRRLVRHLLPHVGATIIVSATLDIGSIILLEAGLSFLGLGLQPPNPTWGNMIYEGRALLFTAPWVALAPGLALTATVIAFNLLGDGLRDALDPRQTVGQTDRRTGP